MFGRLTCKAGPVSAIAAIAAAATVAAVAAAASAGTAVSGARCRHAIQMCNNSLLALSQDVPTQRQNANEGERND